MYLEAAPTDTITRGKKTLSRLVTPEEILDLQQSTLDATVRRSYGKIDSIADKYALKATEDPTIRLAFQEITGATISGMGQLYMVSRLIERYLSARIPIPTIKYGGDITAIYVLQDEPSVAKHARFAHLDLPSFVQCVTNTYEQTLIQQFVAADGQAQRMLSRGNRKLAEDARKIIGISRLSITQLKHLVKYSERALLGEEIPLRSYCEQYIFAIPLKSEPQ